MSKALEEALLDIGTTLLKNPVKKPWYKGAIESYFKTLNQTLLDDKPESFQIYLIRMIMTLKKMPYFDECLHGNILYLVS